MEAGGGDLSQAGGASGALVTIDLSHRRILVTEAAQGLGLGIARHLASCGAALVLSDVNQRLHEHLREALFAKSIGIIQHLADPEAADRILDGAIAWFRGTHLAGENP